MELVAVAAIAENGVIGIEGELPWPSIPEDKQQYRNRVKDAPVLLGRRTFESMLHDLPGAYQIVLTSSPHRRYDVQSAIVVGSTTEAIERAGELTDERAYVLGGGRTYHSLFPHLDRMFLSRIPGEYQGDVTFPEFDENDWRLVEETQFKRFTLQEWARRNDEDAS